MMNMGRVIRDQDQVDPGMQRECNALAPRQPHLDHQHDLADASAAFHLGMRCTGLREREGTVDHRSDLGHGNEWQHVLLHAARDRKFEEGRRQRQLRRQQAA